MTMKYRIVAFEHNMADEAIKLFRTDYRREQENCPLLPDRALEDKKWIKQAMLMTNCSLGAAAFSGESLVGYILANHKFDFKGQPAVIIREFSHSSISKGKAFVYQPLYTALAEQLLAGGINLHIIWHFAHDEVLKETLFQLGFGAFMAGQLRDLSTIDTDGKISVVEEKDWMSIVDLHAEHAGYYFSAPIFIAKKTDLATAKANLEEHAAQGHTLFVYYENKKPSAYFIVGECEKDGEGFLLQKTGTAQIMSAYAMPSARNRGIGRVLLAKTINWAREKGYRRLFVAHETANIYGGNFWRKNFQPFLYCSMRYIDSGLAWKKRGNA